MDVKKLFPVVLACVCAMAMAAFVSGMGQVEQAPGDMDGAAALSEEDVRDGGLYPLLEYFSSRVGDGPGRSLPDGVREVSGAWMAELLASGPDRAWALGSFVAAGFGDGRWYVTPDASRDLRHVARAVGSRADGGASGFVVEPAVPKDAEMAGFTEMFVCCLMLTCGSSLLAAVVLSRKYKREKDTAQVKQDAAARVPGAWQFTMAPMQSAAEPGVARGGVPQVRMEDVEGVPGLKEDVMRLVDCLVNPSRYAALGARTPKGVILYGPPGTGKTLLAKAIAGEAKVPFLSACGSDFVEKYVGVGAKRVRELYDKARRQAPCIVFIDEVDAIASKRGSDENSERDQAVNALLAALDGFDGTSGVVTICATNRLDMLDDAFQRAGRFDLKLAVGLPDVKARRRILEIHSKNKPLEEGVDLDMVARRCPGFSGADLEALMNESAMTAAVRRAEAIGPEDLDEAFFKILMKGNKKPRDGLDETARVTAWHEAGHALATKLLTDDSVPTVTIVGSSSGAGGVTFRAPKDGILRSKKYLSSLVMVMYAGRAAEEICLGDRDLVTTGAQQDIQQATGLIREYLMSYGMGEKGMLDMSQFGKDGGSVVDEAARMAKESYGGVLELLEAHRAILEDLAMALLDRETLDEPEIDAIVGGAAAAAAG